VVDADGVIWNARWGGSCLDAYSPSGERLRTIALPVSRPTCPLFVGADASRMLVTSAREGMTAAEVSAEPDAGKTFLLDFRMKGRLEPRVLLS
jgi:sugar lactone lactonase YvrE